MTYKYSIIRKAIYDAQEKNPVYANRSFNGFINVSTSLSKILIVLFLISIAISIVLVLSSDNTLLTWIFVTIEIATGLALSLMDERTLFKPEERELEINQLDKEYSIFMKMVKFTLKDHDAYTFEKINLLKNEAHAQIHAHRIKQSAMSNTASKTVFIPILVFFLTNSISTGIKLIFLNLYCLCLCFWQ